MVGGCEILHHDGWNPIENRITHLSTGAGFLPSTVSQWFPIFFGVSCSEAWSWQSAVNFSAPWAKKHAGFYVGYQWDVARFMEIYMDIFIYMYVYSDLIFL